MTVAERLLKLGSWYCDKITAMDIGAPLPSVHTTTSRMEKAGKAFIVDVPSRFRDTTAKFAIATSTAALGP